VHAGVSQTAILGRCPVADRRGERRTTLGTQRSLGGLPTIATQGNRFVQDVDLALPWFMGWQVSRSIAFSTGSAASSLSARASHNAIMLLVIPSDCDRSKHCFNALLIGAHARGPVRCACPARREPTAPRCGAGLLHPPHQGGDCHVSRCGHTGPRRRAGPTNRGAVPDAAPDKIHRLLAELVASRALLTSLRAPMTTVDPLAHWLPSWNPLSSRICPTSRTWSNSSPRSATGLSHRWVRHGCGASGRRRCGRCGGRLHRKLAAHRAGTT